MAKPDAPDNPAPTRPSRLPLLLGFLAALLGGGGAFYATRTGLVRLPESADQAIAASDPEWHDASLAAGDVAFIPIEPLIVSVGPGVTGQHLRFRAQLEVAPENRDNVQALIPRVVDVLNSYLRALELEDLEDSSALIRLRSQMLRRIRIVVGADRVRDLLIMEFVLN